MEKVTFRPKNTIILATTGIFWALLLGYFGIGYESGAATYITLLISIAIICMIYLFFIHPKLELNVEGVTIVNPFRTVILKWENIVEVDARFSLYFVTTTGKFSVWAAPVGGAPRFGSSGLRRSKVKEIHISELKGTGQESNDSIAFAHSPTSDSGAALVAARRYLEEYRGRNSH